MTRIFAATQQSATFYDAIKVDGPVMRESPSSSELRYSDCYDQNNTAKTLAGSFLQKSHAFLEKTLPRIDGIATILEVGAGTGHHFPYVRNNFSRYILTDDSREMLAKAEEKYSKVIYSGLLEVEQQDAKRLSYADNSVDRLIATHVLEHLANPVDVLREWNRVVRPDGLISIVLPCDPGLFWRLGRYLGPRRNARKGGLAYNYLMAAEHINSIFNLVVFIRYHFEVLSESWYPLRLPVPDLNLFYACHIRKS